ncbi:GNAT family N-acetyltransferase [Umezawaea sp. Da 62-37]|uniref:GNAT family N-acetyltransferase n=1 Tax=Umezawaea sp. Da 62-37 TaxID=3075927 RepID=UPI0028F74010|nr:GNAT family N-acetyltransferase [Umezawaea sp. Da 62-37]WNV89614.1 GNAT family N-acetyltransferase [Umezawaea sp. Da 62-37]
MEPTGKTTPLTWRLRVQLDDSPGALARVTIRLAERDCNVLALAVIPVPGGVVDEIVVQVAPGLLPADLVEAIRAEGGRCVGITNADVRDLVDAPTAALRAAGNAVRNPGNAVRNPGSACDALRAVLAADSVVVLPAGADGDLDEGKPGHHARLSTREGTVVVARRGWSPFTQVELARATALIELLGESGTPVPQPTALLSSDGMALVLRPGGADDEDAVAGLHTRCSAGTLFTRYHSGMRTLPRRWLHRLLSPPRGSTVVAQCADRVVALGQLIRTSTPDSAEISLLVEDAWQHRGVGTALLGALADSARAAGYRELVAWCLPSETGLVRTAARAGLDTASRMEDGLLRVSITPTPAPLRTPSAAPRARIGGTR